MGVKTVAEFAKEKNVSVQTIYRKLNRVKQINTECLTEKKSGITYITSKGEDILTDALTGVKHEDVKLFNTVKHAESGEIEFLREQNKVLHDELIKEREHSRGQADKLANLAEQLAELSRNNQILLGAEQSRTNPAILTQNEAPATQTQRQSVSVQDDSDEDNDDDYYVPPMRRSFFDLFRKNKRKG